MTEYPLVEKGKWIRVGDIDALVLEIFTDGTLGVGYFQNRTKAIKEHVFWNGNEWKFRYSGPNGSYLRGREEFAVKKGPPICSQAQLATQ